MTDIDKAIAILQKTEDGDNLEAVELKLVELAVNDFLSPAGKAAFDRLFEKVEAGEAS